MIQSKAMYSLQVLVHSDRRRACIESFGKAQFVEVQGFHGATHGPTMEFRPFRSDRPLCATKTRLKPVPMVIHTKALYELRSRAL
jgi:hypothetical protein